MVTVGLIACYGIRDACPGLGDSHRRGAVYGRPTSYQFRRGLKRAFAKRPPELAAKRRPKAPRFSTTERCRDDAAPVWEKYPSPNEQADRRHVARRKQRISLGQHVLLRARIIDETRSFPTSKRGRHLGRRAAQAVRDVRTADVPSQLWYFHGVPSPPTSWRSANGDCANAPPQAGRVQRPLWQQGGLEVLNGEFPRPDGPLVCRTGRR